MINWLTENIGTAAYLKIIDTDLDKHIIIDVRDLVDKDGNYSDTILKKIEDSIQVLNKYNRVVICCDYGMSRSNSIAAGLISMYTKISFSNAVKIVIDKVSVEGIKPEVLSSVFNALNIKQVKSFSDNNILITGANGFIGKTLINNISKNQSVIGLTSIDCDLIKDAIRLDIMVKENNITTLVHLANPRIYTVNSAMGESLTMLKNVLEVCRLNRIKLIFLSSWEVYSGYLGENIVIDESMPIFPKGSYGETKWLSEKLIQHYSEVYGLKYTIIRSSPVYGLGSDKPKFLYNFIQKARKNENIITHEYLNGSPKLDLLSLNDLINAINVIIQKKIDGTINIGSGRLLSTNEIAQLIIKQLGSTSLVSTSKINSYYPGILFNTKKAKELLNWETEDILENFLESLLEKDK